MGPVKAYRNQLNISIQAFPLQTGTLAALIDLIEQGQLSFSAASQHLFPALLEDSYPGAPSTCPATRPTTRARRGYVKSSLKSKKLLWKLAIQALGGNS